MMLGVMRPVVVEVDLERDARAVGVDVVVVVLGRAKLSIEMPEVGNVRVAGTLSM